MMSCLTHYNCKLDPWFRSEYKSDLFVDSESDSSGDESQGRQETL